MQKLKQKRWVRNFILHRHIFLMSIPIVVFYVLFCYLPMYGVIIAFKNYQPRKGVWGSPWVGFEHFRDFFGSYYFKRLLGNTLKISLYSLLWSFPAPIIFALLLNEIRNSRFKKTVQTVTYMPNFISLVVVAGLIRNFVEPEGLITNILVFFGVDRQNLLLNPNYFRSIYIGSGLWQSLGFSSIIYLAAIAAAPPELYEVAELDGAGRFRKMLAVTIPTILPTVITLLILNMGSIMAVGYEKILLLYNDRILETADVISTFVYRKGLLDFNYSYSSAIGLFNSVINCLLLIAANALSRRFTETSLW